MRYKNRYLILNIEIPPNSQGGGSSSPPQRELLNSISESLSTMFGEFAAGMAADSLSIRSYDPVARLAVLRCAREMCPQVRAACTFVSGNGPRKYKLDVLSVLSTSRTCAPAALEQFQERYRGQKGEEESMDARRQELEHFYSSRCFVMTSAYMSALKEEFYRS